MKPAVNSLLMILVMVSGCESTESKPEASDDTNIEQINVEQTMVQETKLVKNSRCGMSPPVLNKQKIQDMLIKSGKIDINASKEKMAQQVKQYIVNKQLAFSKKCR